MEFACRYETAQAKSYQRQGKLGLALKNYALVDKHFDDLNEDQFDFHQYCMRKVTLKVYTELLRWEDSIRNHKWYFMAVSGMVSIYLTLHDAAVAKAKQDELDATSASSAAGDAAAAASAEEEKKRKLKEKKLAKQAKAEAEAKAAAAAAAEKEKGKDAPKSKKKAVDTDPLGEKLAAVENPLAEASKHLKGYAEHHHIGCLCLFVCLFGFLVHHCVC